MLQRRTARHRFESMMQEILSIIGISLIIAGLAIAVIAFALLAKSSRFKGSGGAVLLIGPIPIIISSNKRMTIVMLALTSLLALILLVEFYGSRL